MIAHILNEDDGETGLTARQKLNAVIDIINDLASDYISKNGTGSTGMIAGDFLLNDNLPTRFITDDGTIENGLLWYGGLSTSLVSQKKSDASYAAFSVALGNKADIQVQNYTSGVNTAITLEENEANVLTGSTTFTFKGNADYSPNAVAWSFVQRCYVDDRFIPLQGTDPSKPVTNVIEYLNSFGTAIGSTSGFYIGSGDVLDLDNWSYGSRILFDAPALGKKASIYLSGPLTNVDARNGTSRNALTMNANGSYTWFQLLSNNGTHSSNLILNAEGSAELSSDDPAYKGLVGSADFSPNYSTLSYIQKVFSEKRYAKIIIKDAVDSANLTGAGSVNPTIMKSWLIPAGTMVAEDIFNLVVIASKSGSNGVGTIRLHANTSNSLTGAVEIASNGPAAASRWIPIQRTFIVKTTTSTFGYNTSSPVASDMINGTTARALYSINWAADVWIIASGQNVSSIDGLTINTATLIKL